MQSSVITFPKLGLHIDIDPVAFSLFGKPVYWYALIILGGFLAALLLVCRGSEKRGLQKDAVWDIALSGIIAGIIGARIYYVLFSWNEYRDDIRGIFRIWEGGLAIYGGIIGGVIASVIYCRHKKINILNAYDVCCVGLLLGQAIGRWGNFFNCEVYGRVTESVFGMSIDGGPPVIPLFLCESVWNLAGVILILLIRDFKKKNGQLLCLYMFWYAAGRLYLEGLRDSAYILYLIPGKLGVSQAVSAIFILISVIGFIWISKSDNKYLTPLPPIGKPEENKNEEMQRKN